MFSAIRICYPIIACGEGAGHLSLFVGEKIYRFSVSLLRNLGFFVGLLACSRWFLLIDFINQETAKTGDLDGVNFEVLSGKIDHSAAYSDRFCHPGHAELVSASISLQGKAVRVLRWMLKRVQHDGWKSEVLRYPKQSPFPAVPWGKGYCHAATNCRHFGRGFGD
jgi:hypothetical protein